MSSQEPNPNPDRIPIEFMGQDAYIDLSQPTMVHYRFTDDSEFADSCWERCDPEGLRDFVGSQSAAEFSMMNVMNGGKGGEYIIDIRAVCGGPRRKFLRGERCGACITKSVVELPFDETHPEEAIDPDV